MGTPAIFDKFGHVWQHPTKTEILISSFTDPYLSAENQKDLMIPSGDFRDQRKLQPDWLRVFWVSWLEKRDFPSYGMYTGNHEYYFN